MADELLAQAQDLFEGQIDFAGQKQADYISTVLLIVSGIVAFIAGYLKQDIYLSLFVGMGGALLTFLVVVPPWPFYNQHPEKWLSTASSSSSSSGQPAIVASGGKNTLMFDGKMLTI